MLAAKYRLKGNNSFLRVEKEGKLVQSTSFGLAFFPRRDNEASCFGVIVSKKVSLESAMRNTLKRVFFETLRQNWADIKNGFDVVFLVKTSALRKPTEELMREIKTSLKESGISN